MKRSSLKAESFSLDRACSAQAHPAGLLKRWCAPQTSRSADRPHCRASIPMPDPSQTRFAPVLHLHITVVHPQAVS